MKWNGQHILAKLLQCQFSRKYIHWFLRSFMHITDGWTHYSNIHTARFWTCLQSSFIIQLARTTHLSNTIYAGNCNLSLCDSDFLQQEMCKAGTIMTHKWRPVLRLHPQVQMHVNCLTQTIYTQNACTGKIYRHNLHFLPISSVPIHSIGLVATYAKINH